MQRLPLSGAGSRSPLSSLLQAGVGIPRSHPAPCAAPPPSQAGHPPRSSSLLGGLPAGMPCGAPPPSQAAGTVPGRPPHASPEHSGHIHVPASLPSAVSPLWAASSFYFCLPLSLLPFTCHGHHQVLHLDCCKWPSTQWVVNFHLLNWTAGHFPPEFGPLSPVL